MELTLTILFGVLGLAVGSFLNVCIDRLPARKSLSHPPSRCDACGHRLAVIDLVPVLSYLLLRGRCRYCRAPIPLSVPLVEAGAGVIFAFLFIRYGLTYQFGLLAAYSNVLLVLAIIDLRHRLILNVIVYPAAIFVLMLDLFLPGMDTWRGPAGGAIGFGILFVPAIISRKGMGEGDVKMAGLIGLMTGFPAAIAAVLTAIVTGGLTALAMLLSGKKNRQDAIPFGPFLAFGGFVGLLWGQDLITWYLRLFSRLP